MKTLEKKKKSKVFSGGKPRKRISAKTCPKIAKGWVRKTADTMKNRKEYAAEPFEKCEPLLAKR